MEDIRSDTKPTHELHSQNSLLEAAKYFSVVVYRNAMVSTLLQVCKRVGWQYHRPIHSGNSISRLGIEVQEFEEPIFLEFGVSAGYSTVHSSSTRTRVARVAGMPVQEKIVFESLGLQLNLFSLAVCIDFDMPYCIFRSRSTRLGGWGRYRLRLGFRLVIAVDSDSIVNLPVLTLISSRLADYLSIERV